MQSQTIELNFSFTPNFKCAVNLNNNLSFGERERILLHAYVPGVKIPELVGEKKVEDTCFTIHYNFSKDKKISYENNKIFICDDWSKEIPVYFFHLIYSICHQVWLEREYYAVHSAGVGINGSWSLLVGNSGVGKTTVMLNLLQNHGFEMFSTNKTLLRFNADNTVSQLEALAGTTTITSRCGNQTGPSRSEAQKINFAGRFAYKLPSDKNHSLHLSAPIKKIYVIRLNSAVKECEQLSNFEALVTLYPFFLDYINSDIMVFDGAELHEGTNFNSKTKKILLKSMRDALPSIDVYTLKGSLEFISNIICEHYE